MSDIDLTAAIEAGAWALIDSDTDVVDRGVSEDHYGQRLDDAKIALTAALPHIEQQYVKPSRDEIARALFISSDPHNAEHMAKAWDGPGDGGRQRWWDYADAVLALLPGKSEGEVKAEALREAAGYLTVATIDPAYEGQANDGEFGSGFYQAVRSARRALRDRADAIERGEGI